MKFKLFAAVAILCLISAVAYGQAGLTGKWQTDNAAAAQAAQAAAPAAPEAGGRGGRGGGGGQAIIMDLKQDGNTISGTVTEIGNPPVLTIENGTITGKTITWVTQPRGVTWNLELTDDNTISLTSRVIGNRGGGGRGPGGGGAPGAAGGAPGGGAPGGPGPGAAAGGGGVPGAGAPGGAPAGAPGPGGPGGPGGGGGGGFGGRGGGGGRGPQQPIVLHRAN